MNNRKQFILDSNSLKIKEALNKDFLEVELYAISEGENVNGSNFTLTSMEKSIPTFYNKFILGYFNTHGGTQEDGNFEEHNADVRYDKEYDEHYYSYTAPNAEKALGIIRESDKVEIVEYKGKKWIRLTAAILTKYNREAVKHLLKSKRKRKISVEITIEKYHTDENGIDIIEEYTLDGITILGNRKGSYIPCEEGIKGAELRILNFLETEVFNKQKKALSFAYSNLDAENRNEQKDEIEMQKNHKETEEEPMNEENKQIFEENIAEEDNSFIEEKFASEEAENNEEKECKCNEQEQDKDDCDNNEQHSEEEDNKDTYICDEEKKEEEEDIQEKENCSKDEEDIKEDKDAEEDRKEDCAEKEDECQYEEKIEEKQEEEDEEPKKEEEACNQENDGEIFSVECSFGEVVCENEMVRDNLQVLVTNYIQIQKDYEEIKAKYDALIKEGNIANLLRFGVNMISEEDILSTEDISSITATYTEECKNGKFVSEDEVKQYLKIKFAEVAYNQAKSNKKNEINKAKEFSAKIQTPVIDQKVETDTFAQMKQLLNM